MLQTVSLLVSILKIALIRHQSAYKAARDDIIKELTDCWCDVIPSVVTEEWRVCRKGKLIFLLISVAWTQNDMSVMISDFSFPKSCLCV